MSKGKKKTAVEIIPPTPPVTAPSTPTEIKLPTLKELKNELNFQQAKFCELYAGDDMSIFGNGTRCYAIAYGHDLSRADNQNVCAASACELLRIPKICAYINALLDDSGLNDQNVDRQTLFLINQHEDKTAKIKAISEYNKVRKRVTNRTELSGLDGGPIEVSDATSAKSKLLGAINGVAAALGTRKANK